jgi:hypothetical protein
MIPLPPQFKFLLKFPQIWVDLCTYLLLAITKKRFGIQCLLYTFLQILEVNLLEEKLISSLIVEALKQYPEPPYCNKLNL